MTERLTFQQNPNRPNELIQGDGFYLSYNPAPSDGRGLFAADGRGDETALYIEQGGVWLILNGDHRAEYEEAANRGGLEACIAVYESRRAVSRSSWSTDSRDAASIAEWFAKRVEGLDDDGN